MSSSSSSGLSNVGSRALYEAGDQRNEPQSVLNERAKFEEGQHRSHQNLDSSMSSFPCGWSAVLTEAEDQRSIGNRLAAQENSSNPSKPSASNYDPEAELSKRNPEAPVCCSFFPFFSCLVNPDWC